jgi:flagella basal body P-ring formation protein FlgA
MALALQPGIVGSMVRARNVDTGVILNGVVRPDGRIEVGG